MTRDHDRTRTRTAPAADAARPGDDAAHADLGPVPRSSLTDETVAALERWILARRADARSRLPSERDLATRLGVSRIVVREAVARLVTRGLLEVRPGVGTYVAPVRDASVTEPLRLYLARRPLRTDDLFDLRLALEPEIAAAAATRADAAATRRLRAALARARADGDAVDPDRPDTLEAFAWSDVEFHQELARASGNPLFDLLLAPLIDRLLAVRRTGARHPGSPSRANAGHAAVLDAIEARDPDRARAAMRAHLGDVRALLPADLAPDADDPTEVAADDADDDADDDPEHAPVHPPKEPA